MTLVCERPKIKPHREAMRARLAEILELPLDAVSVKATTMERMGFTGREEGLASQAVAMVELPRGLEPRCSTGSLEFGGAPGHRTGEPR